MRKVLLWAMLLAFSGWAQEAPGKASFRYEREPVFIENRGQWHPDVLYLCRLKGLDAWITRWGVNYTFYRLEREEGCEERWSRRGERGFSRLVGHRVLCRYVGANRCVQAEGRAKRPGYYNYFIGNDPPSMPRG